MAVSASCLTAIESSLLRHERNVSSWGQHGPAELRVLAGAGGGGAWAEASGSWRGAGPHAAGPHHSLPHLHLGRSPARPSPGPVHVPIPIPATECCLPRHTCSRAPAALTWPRDRDRSRRNGFDTHFPSLPDRGACGVPSPGPIRGPEAAPGWALARGPTRLPPAAPPGEAGQGPRSRKPSGEQERPPDRAFQGPVTQPQPLRREANLQARSRGRPDRCLAHFHVCQHVCLHPAGMSAPCPQGQLTVLARASPTRSAQPRGGALPARAPGAPGASPG